MYKQLSLKHSFNTVPRKGAFKANTHGSKVDYYALRPIFFIFFLFDNIKRLADYTHQRLQSALSTQLRYKRLQQERLLLSTVHSVTKVKLVVLITKRVLTRRYKS